MQDPDTLPVPKNGSTIKDRWDDPVPDDKVRLLRRLETHLIYAYLITMSTQSGAPNHFARPHMVEQAYYETYGRWHGDMCGMGLAGDAQDEAYRLFGCGESLKEGLLSFDPEHYQHEVRAPKNDYVDYDYILDFLRPEPSRIRICGYGSASSFIDKVHKDPLDLFYEVSKFVGLTVDGGGTRSAMLGMKLGVLKALAEGYDVLNLGILSQTDVSPIEGNIRHWIKSMGYEVHEDKDPRHIHFADGHMHALTLDRLLQRQAPIAGLSHLSLLFGGGKGTVVEDFITVVNNARLKILGRGLVSDRFIPLLQVDHDFEHGPSTRRMFDALNECCHGDAGLMEWLGVHQFTNTAEPLDFTRQFASGKIAIELHPRLPKQKWGFDISPNRLKNYVPGTDISRTSSFTPASAAL